MYINFYTVLEKNNLRIIIYSDIYILCVYIKQKNHLKN